MSSRADKTQPSSLQINDPPQDLTLEAFLPFTLMSAGLANERDWALLHARHSVRLYLSLGEETGCKPSSVERGAHAEAVLGVPRLPCLYSGFLTCSLRREAVGMGRSFLNFWTAAQGRGGHKTRASGPGFISKAGRPHEYSGTRQTPREGSLVALTLVPETQFPILPARGDDTAPRPRQVCELGAARGPGGPGTPLQEPLPREPLPSCGYWSLWPCQDAAPWPPGAGAEAGRDTPGVGVEAVGTARSAGGRAWRAGSRGLPAGSRLPVAGTERWPPARPSRTTGHGLRPEGVPPKASPPCARSATSNSLHCPAPPRSRPSPSSQPFTPPNRQGRAQEGPASRDPDGTGPPGCATAAPGGPEGRAAARAPQQRACALRPRAVEDGTRRPGSATCCSRT